MVSGRKFDQGTKGSQVDPSAGRKGVTSLTAACLLPLFCEESPQNRSKTAGVWDSFLSDSQVAGALSELPLPGGGVLQVLRAATTRLHGGSSCPKTRSS